MPPNFTQAFGKTFTEFSKNSTLHGFQYLTPRCDRTLLERFIWSVVMVISITCVIYLVMFSWNEFMDDPTVTTLETPNHSITNLPFPGVSICNLNKISRTKALAYARQLAKKANSTTAKMFEIVRHMGKLYDFGAVASDDVLVEYQAILDTHDYHNATNGFNPYATLKKLAPSCDELLSNCSWNSQNFSCSFLFIFEATMEGFCCIFNYVPPVFKNQNLSGLLQLNKNNTIRPVTSGINAGLTAMIHPNVDDYCYPLISSIGANSHIFNSDDFPDTSSGSLQERLVPLGVQMFMRLFATAIHAVPEVRRYPLAKRNCKFREEAQTLFGTKYSYSDCILECRLRSMMALCQCIPFNFIKAIYGEKLPQCSLVDIPCTNRYKEKWRRLYPLHYAGDDLDTDKQDSLSCGDCVPTCQNTLYTVRNDFAYLTAASEQQANYSVVNIFFESDDAKLYKQDVVFYWFEIVSSFGGTCSLMLGLSLISIFEFVYFFTVVLYKNYCLDVQ